jgi:hypothetical protein
VTCLAVLAITLTTALPALANGDSPDGIITPGFGTLGALIDWLWLLVFR